jgi:uncharacterized protein
MADILSDRTEAELNRLISNLEQTNAYISKSSRYRICPQCDELTVTRTETTLKKATHQSKGKLLISDRCYCCDYCQDKTIDIPRLRPPSNSGGGNRNTDYYSSWIIGSYNSNPGSDNNNSSYGGSSSSSGSDSSTSSSGGSSGGDFGGGSSGGGGAGGSW